MILKLIEIFLLFYHINMFTGLFDTSSNRDTNSSFDFITSEHPDFNAPITNIFKRGFDVFLESILNPSDTEEFHALFQQFNGL